MITKTISQCDETGSVQNDDLLLLQRGEKYYSIKSQNLGGGLFKVSYELTQAEIDDLANTPIEVVPAYGANTYINIVGAVAFRNGTAFTAIDAVLKLVFTGQTQAYRNTNAGFLTAVASTVTRELLPVAAGTDLFENTGISVYVTSNPTSTGPITVQIIYNVATFI